MNTKEKKSQKPKFHFSLLTSHFLLKKKGQVAVILILVVAAGLIFYAVTLNLGRISQTKALVTTASNTMASQLASQMASYGQEVSERELEGQFKKCASSGVLRAFLMVVIAVVVAFFCGPCAAAVGKTILYVLVAATATSLALQVAVIEPSLSRKWNEMYRNLKTVQDLYTEIGIRTGLEGVVTDRVRVPDFFDEDQDQVWGLDASNAPLDTISRFGIYYTERLKSIQPRDTTDVQSFIDSLRRFLYENPAMPVTLDNWALIDRAVGCSTSECNPCCVPASDPLDTAVPPAPLRPEDCTAAMIDSCDDNSPYGINYPWVYDPFYENPGNVFLSLREQLGRDDEHQLFRKNSFDPNGIQVQTGAPPPPLPPNNFLIEDTTGYYATDNRGGIFSYFYKLADWRLDLTAWDWDPLAFNPPVNNPVEQCYWVAQAWAPYGPLCAAVTPTMPLELQSPMSLPNDPSTLSQNTTLYVDGDNNRVGSGFPPLNPGDPPLATDRIGALGPADRLRAVVADQALCAEKILTQVAPPLQGFWKKGGDRFCSDTVPPAWPYSENCPKEAGCTDPLGLGCICEDNITPAENWPDDALDAIVYGVQDFIIDAEEILALGDDAQIAARFETWYPDIAQWIEPGTDPDPLGSGAVAGTDCFVCNVDGKDGKLVTMYKMIREMRLRLESLRDTSYASAPGVCDEAWCVPGSGCPGVPALEAATFDSNPDLVCIAGCGGNLVCEAACPRGNGIYGDMEDITACVNWNANDEVIFSDDTPLVPSRAVGNADKFQKCVDACAVNNLVIEKCSNLPRSLVPGVNTGLPSPNPAVVCAPGLGGWLDGIQRSIPEAQNQVAKFRQRHTFLRNRLNEVNIAINILNNAEIKFNEFLACPAGPACLLIQARIDYTAQAQAPGLPYQVIYGWQDEPDEGQPPGSGRWHIVKVDARVPKRCEGYCGVGGSSDPSNFPWVRTYSKGFLKSKRCYEMTDTEGMVKARVTRFDESRGSSILFPNGVPLWEFRYGHPDRPAGDPEDMSNLYNLVGLDTTCRTSMVADPPGLPPGPTNVYSGAFIMNERLEPSTDQVQCFSDCSGNLACEAVCLGNVECWDGVLNILTRGVTTDTCANYYWHDNTNAGMGFKFVSCPNF